MDFFTGIDHHLRVLRAVLGEVTAAELTGATGRLADADVVAVLAEATAVAKAADAVRTVAAGVVTARSAREAGHGGLAQTRGHRSPVSLVQEITGSTGADAARRVRLGTSLLDAQPVVRQPGPGAPEPDAAPVPEPWHAALGAALLTGAITAAQQDTILRNLGDPPTGDDWVVAPVAVEAWRTAVEQLILEAAARTVEELGRAARTVRDLLDPDGAERRFLQRFEARSFRTWTDADGVHRGSFVFDDEGYAWARSVIDAALRPRTGGPRFVDSDEKARAEDLVADPRTNDQLTYDLIIDLLRAGALTDATAVFGVKQPGVRVVRVVPRDSEAADATGYVEETGDPVPTTFLNRCTCDTGSTECTLDADGNPLYLGREARLFSPKQKIALALRDGGCRIPGCDRPPHYCEAHHIDEYAKGGKTNVDRGILLCRFHHMNLHHRGWSITRKGAAQFVLQRPGSPPVVLRPRVALAYAWAGIDPPPERRRRGYARSLSA